jgi:hypothetical protein
VELGKIKQKAVIKFAEGIQQRIRMMSMEEETKDMDACDIISKGFKDYLFARILILKLLAEVSSA